MTNINEIQVTDSDGNVTEHIIVNYNDGSFTSMTKETYDAQQAASTLVTESAPTAQ